MTNINLTMTASDANAMMNALCESLIHALPYDPANCDSDDDQFLILAHCILDLDFDIDDAPAANAIALTMHFLCMTLAMNPTILTAYLRFAYESINR
jgi:hypothetical protein